MSEDAESIIADNTTYHRRYYERQIQRTASTSSNDGDANICKDNQVCNVSDNDILSCVYSVMVSPIRINDIVIAITFITQRRA